MGIRRLRVMLLVLLAVTAFCAPALAEKTDMAHYLLIGVDGWGLNEVGSARSDAIILASLDYGRDRIYFTSFARDSIVEPSYRKGAVKLNTVIRSSDGERALVRYIEEAFALKIEGYFVINFSGAVDLINALGGVKLNLTENEVYYLNHNAGEYRGYPLSPGECTVNGAQALYYMRCRSLDNDFGRHGRQGNVLRAVMKKVSTLSPLRAMGLLDDVLGMYRTSLHGGRQVELALKALKLRNAQVFTKSLPEEGMYRYVMDSHGASGLSFDLEKNRESLYAWLEIENPFEKIKTE